MTLDRILEFATNDLFNYATKYFRVILKIFSSDCFFYAQKHIHQSCRPYSLKRGLSVVDESVRVYGCLDLRLSHCATLSKLC